MTEERAIDHEQSTRCSQAKGLKLIRENQNRCVKGDSIPLRIVCSKGVGHNLQYEFCEKLVNCAQVVISTRFVYQPIPLEVFHIRYGPTGHDRT
jgi:hypothetical protein